MEKKKVVIRNTVTDHEAKIKKNVEMRRETHQRGLNTIDPSSVAAA
jgi:hypothetical protein